MFLIQQFILSNTELGLVVQNAKGITIVTDEKLANFLVYIDDKGINNFCVEDLEGFIDDENITDAMEFLINNEIIFEKIEIEGEFSKIGIYTNDEILKEYFKFVEDNRFEIIENENLFDKYENVFSFVHPFSIIEYNRICDILSKKNIPFIMSFFYDSKFYVTNLYKKEWYNPCPKCFYANLETALRGYGKINDSPSFQTIMDIIYSQNPMFKLNIPLKKRDYFSFINELLKYSFESFNINSKRIIEIDLNGNVNYDIPIHFELCDCFEK